MILYIHILAPELFIILFSLSTKICNPALMSKSYSPLTRTYIYASMYLYIG